MLTLQDFYAGRAQKVLATIGLGELGGSGPVAVNEGLAIMELGGDDKISWHDGIKNSF